MAVSESVAPLVGIISALGAELAPLKEEVEDKEQETIGTRRYVRGRLKGIEVVLTSTGDGAVRAAREVRKLIERFPVSCLLGVGIAGGLSPGLAPGAVLVAEDVRTIEGEIAPPPDASWLSVASGIEGVEKGTLLTSPRLITESRKKVLLGQQVAEGRFAAVDMESYLWALEAAHRGLPYLVLRAISDTAAENLPAYLTACQRPDGSTSQRCVAQKALLHPHTMGILLKMVRRLRHCADRLAHTTVALFETMPYQAKGGQKL